MKRWALTFPPHRWHTGGESKERLGSDFAASPILADGRLYFFDARGKGTVVQAGATFSVLATNTLEAGCMASPAVAGRSLIVRTKTHLYRIE